MKKTIFALATAATLAVGTLSAPTTADARCYGCAVGAGVAAGVIGGAIIGGAIANSQPTTGRLRAMSCIKVMAPPIRSPARAAIGPAGRCMTVTATSSAGAVRVSSALKDRVTTWVDDRAEQISAREDTP